MKIKPNLRNAACFAGTFLSIAVAVFSYRYIANLGFVPPNVAANRFFDTWIVIHTSTASTALLLGPLQFMSGMRKRWPSLHRWTGWTYIISCFTGGASGIVLASGTSAGPIAGLGFGVLGIIWLYVTTQGILAARGRDFFSHRLWMIRSFALTFGAVTLRLYIPFSQILGVDFITAYRAIAWLGWIPNAIIAEWYVRRFISVSTRCSAVPSTSRLKIEDVSNKSRY